MLFLHGAYLAVENAGLPVPVWQSACGQKATIGENFIKFWQRSATGQKATVATNKNGSQKRRL